VREASWLERGLAMEEGRVREGLGELTVSADFGRPEVIGARSSEGLPPALVGDTSETAATGAVKSREGARFNGGLAPAEVGDVAGCDPAGFFMPVGLVRLVGLLMPVDPVGECKGEAAGDAAAEANAPAPPAEARGELFGTGMPELDRGSLLAEPGVGMRDMAPQSRAQLRASGEPNRAADAKHSGTKVQERSGAPAGCSDGCSNTMPRVPVRGAASSGTRVFVS
jgi:hypothetical protein